jgi:HlyD family secretion protein
MTDVPITKRPARRLTYFLGGLAAAALVAVGSSLPIRHSAWSRRPNLDQLPRAVVHRADLQVTVQAGGEVQSSQQTVIQCDLENLQVSVQGRVLAAGGSSSILELVPDGTTVRKGEVLCRLDSADYEELVREQLIKVEQARAEFRRAQLTVDTAKSALREYRDGLSRQAEEQFRGRIALAHADIQRQTERLTWTKHMAQIGYLPQSRVTDEPLTLDRARFSLEQAQTDFQTFLRFGRPDTMRLLDADLFNANLDLDYQSLRVERQETRLERLKRQVEYCTIRAPHDGFVIYAPQQNGGPKIEPGIIVRQRQNLFFLPDLSRLEVHALLHESVVERIRNGMPARVRVEGLPRLNIEGHVVSVAPLPVRPSDRRISDEVKNYLGRVELHAAPEGLLPGMTAEVEILTAQRPSALVIPPQALTVARGKDVCYVAHDESIERREVAIGRATPNLLEVTRGLAEGEEVVLEPTRLDLPQDVIVDNTPEPPSTPEPAPAH